ncbi:unnamed protein product, partial [Ixodes pacificus]
RAVPPEKGSGAKAAPSSGTKKAGPAAKRLVGRPPKSCGVKPAAPAKLPSVDSSRGPSSQEAGKSRVSRDSRLPGRGRKVAASTDKDVSPPAASKSPSGGSSRAHLRSSPRRPARPEPSPSRRLDVKATEKKAPKKASTAAVAAFQLPAVEASVGRRDKELPVAEQAPTTGRGGGRLHLGGAAAPVAPPVAPPLDLPLRTAHTSDTRLAAHDPSMTSRLVGGFSRFLAFSYIFGENKRDIQIHRIEIHQNSPLTHSFSRNLPTDHKFNVGRANLRARQVRCRGDPRGRRGRCLHVRGRLGGGRRPGLV